MLIGLILKYKDHQGEVVKYEKNGNPRWAVSRSSSPSREPEKIDLGYVVVELGRVIDHEGFAASIYLNHPSIHGSEMSEEEVIDLRLALEEHGWRLIRSSH